MMSTVHLVTGAAIGLAAKDYWQVIFLSFLMHFLLDMIPHWDPKFRKNKRWYLIASFDLLIGFLLAFWLVGAKLDGKIFLAMMCSILPDIITILFLFFGKQYGKYYIHWHKKIQNRDISFWGKVSQFIVLVVMSFVILTRK